MEPKGVKHWPAWKMGLFDIVCLTPAVLFWSSVLLYVTYGTDYFFDVVLDQWGRTTLGNTLLTILVVGLPGLAVGVNGMAYMVNKKGWQKIVLVMAIIFLILGFYAVLKKA